MVLITFRILAAMVYSVIAKAYLCLPYPSKKGIGKGAWAKFVILRRAGGSHLLT